MDDIDVANDQVAQFVEMAVRAAVSRKVIGTSSGICRACGLDIETRRLRVDPAALMCHDCAEEAEAQRVRAKRTGLGH